MQYKMSFKSVVIALVLGSVLMSSAYAGCLSFDDKEFEEIMVGPSNPLPSGVKIAILDMDTPGYESWAYRPAEPDLVSDILRTRLINAGKGYEVYDRDQMEKLLAEQELQLDGVVEPTSEDMVAMAKAAGLDYLIYGTLKNAKIGKTEIVPVWKTMFSNGLTDKAPGFLGGMAKNELRGERRVSSMFIDIRLTDVKTGRIYHSSTGYKQIKELRGISVSRETGRRSTTGSMTSADEAYATLSANAVDEFSKALAPWKFTGELQYCEMKELDELDNEEIDRKLEKAQMSFEQGDFPGAINGYAGIIRYIIKEVSDPDEDALRSIAGGYVNLALIFELYSNLEKSEEYYEKAQKYYDCDDTFKLLASLHKKLGDDTGELDAEELNLDDI